MSHGNLEIEKSIQFSDRLGGVSYKAFCADSKSFNPKKYSELVKLFSTIHIEVNNSSKSGMTDEEVEEHLNDYRDRFELKYTKGKSSWTIPTSDFIKMEIVKQIEYLSLPGDVIREFWNLLTHNIFEEYSTTPKNHYLCENIKTELVRNNEVARNKLLYIRNYRKDKIAKKSIYYKAVMKRSKYRKLNEKELRKVKFHRGFRENDLLLFLGGLSAVNGQPYYLVYFPIEYEKSLMLVDKKDILFRIDNGCTCFKLSDYLNNALISLGLDEVFLEVYNQNKTSGLKRNEYIRDLYTAIMKLRSFEVVIEANVEGPKKGRISFTHKDITKQPKLKNYVGMYGKASVIQKGKGKFVEGHKTLKY